MSQPEESARHDPYHYRAYGLHAMITNARLGAYAGVSDIWSSKSATGGTIKNAMDYAMTFSPDASNEAGALPQMFPIVAATKLAYGDPDGKYGKFLNDNDPNHLTAPYWFWDVRGADGSPVQTSANGTAGGSGASKKGNGAQGGFGATGLWSILALAAGTLVLVL